MAFGASDQSVLLVCVLLVGVHCAFVLALARDESTYLHSVLLL